MDLKRFKGSWQQYKLLSGLDRLESSEVLEIINNSVEERDFKKLIHWSVLFLVLTICLQGG